MKSRLLLFALVLTAASLAVHAQTFHIEWKNAETVVGDGTKTLKREGTVVNDAATEKRLRIRYDISNVSLDHFGQICLTQCFAMLPGDEDYPGREDQVLPASGSAALYVDMDPGGNLGTSSVAVDLYDKNAPTTEIVSFTVTFVFDPTQSVVEAADRGFSVGPVPATDQVTVRGNGTEFVKGANLYAADGTLLRTYGGGSGDAATYSLSGLPAGPYHLILHTMSGSMLHTSVSVLR